MDSRQPIRESKSNGEFTGAESDIWDALAYGTAFNSRIFVSMTDSEKARFFSALNKIASSYLLSHFADQDHKIPKTAHDKAKKEGKEEIQTLLNLGDKEANDYIRDFLTDIKQDFNDHFPVRGR